MTNLLMYAHFERFNEIHIADKLYTEMLELHKIGLAMRFRGIGIDPLAKANHEQIFYKTANDIADKITNFTKKLGFDDFNYNSRLDMVKLFIEKLQMGVIKTTVKGEPSFDINVLLIYAKSENQIVATLARLIISHKKIMKTLVTYAVNLPIKNSVMKWMNNKMLPISKVHPIWIPSATKTRRWGCKVPNVMNIPKARPQFELPSMRNMYIGHYRKIPYLLTIPK
ncbi:MAG: hypothetical protein HC877_18840 [Thioploca sp.]|nr:hypothetical protein [Thioploca sp.]